MKVSFKFRIAILVIIIFILLPACKDELFEDLGMIEESEEMEIEIEIEDKDNLEIEIEETGMENLKIKVVRVLGDPVINQDRIIKNDQLNFDPSNPDDVKIYQGFHYLNF